MCAGVLASLQFARQEIIFAPKRPWMHFQSHLVRIGDKVKAPEAVVECEVDIHGDVITGEVAS